MSDSAVSKLPKPEMRRLLQKQIKFNLITAIVMAVGTGIAMKFLLNDPHKQVYADFYKTYDINKEFNKMRNKGLFDSCDPDN